MKKLVLAITGLAVMGAGMSNAQAGDRGWATAGKVLTGVVAASIIHDAVHGDYHHHHGPAFVPAPVVVHRPVCAPAPVVVQRPVYVQQPVVVQQQPVYVQQPVVVQQQPVYVQQPVVVQQPAPVYVQPAPVVLQQTPVYVQQPATITVTYSSGPIFRSRVCR